MKKLILALVVFGLLPVLAQADDPMAEFEKADRLLNETYAKVRRRLADDPGSADRLVHAQRAWITFRDAECAFQSRGEDGGSVAPVVIAACKATLTGERIGQLRAYLHCEEGDLACLVPAE